jgi:hypothetical protein
VTHSCSTMLATVMDFILFNLKPTSCWIVHSDAFQRRNLNSLYVAINIIWTNEIDT